MATNQYSFPELTIKQLLEALQNIVPELCVVKADLKNPQPQRMIKIYELILKALRIDMNNLNQPTLRVLENIENTEMMEDSLPVLAFTNYLRYVLNNIGYPDFHMGDILHPDERRSRRILSAFCNFLCFVEEQRPDYERTLMEAEAQKERCNKLKTKFDSLKQQRDRLREKQKENEKKKIAINAQLEQAQKNIQSKQLEKMELMSICSKTKTEGIELEKKLEYLKDRTRQATLENEIISQKIIKSPEKLIQRIQSTDKELDQLKMKLKDQNDRNCEIKQHLEKIKSWSLDMTYLVQQANNIKIGVDKQTHLKSDIKKANNKNVAMELNLNAIKSKQTERDLQLKNREEQKHSLELQAKAKLASIHAEINHVKKQISQTDEDELIKSNLSVEIDQMNAEIDSIAKNTQNFIREKKEQTEKLVKDTEKKSQDLIAILRENDARYDDFMKIIM